MLSKDARFGIIFSLGTVYFISFWLLTVGYFAPATFYGNSFKLLTPAIVVVYTNASLLIIAIIFDMFEYTLYMSFLSISFGVFYPVAAILTLVATVFMERAYKWNTGYSAILCTIAGGLMLIFYVGLILYDRQYINRSMTASSSIVKNAKQTKVQWEHRRNHASKRGNSFYETNMKNNCTHPVRNRGLRRT